MTKGGSLDQNIDHIVKLHGFNTRVLAFLSDPDDYKQEVEYLKSVGEKLAHRINLRIGIIDSPMIVRYYRK